MHTLSLRQLSEKLRNRDISSVELTQYFLDRIEQLDPELNSFITVTPEVALEMAKMADAALAEESAGPLTGIPVAHKDLFTTEGIRTSCASRMLDNFIAPYDAQVVEKLKQAGMPILGKTNMDEFAMGSSNETSYYGPARNP
ncbi:MAG TPA: Asp-tRNA(Asn)/Glu-tRNA(Gln) amidotransferase GatCAB subunit A, partial [Sulfurivirga caldicuralii]|nr:Asp-tRNA(Asn)/Glu-tRNA(Gln) amidotransferase GatCAB subunit A [Sulfurivirga caldicuralii]